MMKKTINLTNLTLACVDCKRQAGSSIAMLRSMEHINFGKVMFLTETKKDVDPALHKHVTIIPKIVNHREYSKFIWYKMADYVTTDHVLIVQHDGYILNPFYWDDRFTRYDYIGAVWHFIEDERFCVGNGGFSIRSKRLLKHTQNFQTRNYHPEDVSICRTHRERLLKSGFTFASRRLSKLFSVEDSKWEGQLGFHNPTITDISKYSPDRNYQVNVITRTSGRPKAFKRCIESVREQSYPHIRHIVSVDDKETANYVKGYGVEYVNISRPERLGEEDFPYNLYLNNLLARVKEGWVLILDDDDYLCDKDAIKDIINRCYDNDTLVFSKMKWSSGRIIPSDANFGKSPQSSDIGSPCFCFNIKYFQDHNIMFDRKKCADFRFANNIYSLAPNKEYINKILVGVGNDGDKGNRSDI